MLDTGPHTLAELRALQADLLDRSTCRTCHGNGWLGGRRFADGTDTGLATTSVDAGRRCEPCDGTGLRSRELGA